MIFLKIRDEVLKALQNSIYYTQRNKNKTYSRFLIGNNVREDRGALVSQSIGNKTRTKTINPRFYTQWKKVFLNEGEIKFY